MVAAYWRENYDLALYLQRNWPVLRDDLDGKLHLIVGSADDHYLDASAYSLQQKLSALEADVDFVFVEGKTHNNLFARDGDQLFLLRDIAKAMYRVARPDNE